MTTEIKETAPKPPNQEASDVSPEIKVLKEGLDALRSENEALRTELAGSLTSSTKNAEESYKRALALRDEQHQAQLKSLRTEFEAEKSKWSEAQGNYKKKLGQLSIEAQVRGGEIKFLDEAIDLVVERVNRDVTLDPITGEILVSPASGASSLSEYLAKLAESKPNLVQSKMKGGSGDKPDSRKHSTATSGEILPPGFNSWDAQERRKYLLEHPEVREAIRQQRITENVSTK
jgi:hypothetical protein